ncbi:MAG: CAP domain-containing protein [Thermomicrobiales bacterium]
MRFNTHDDTNSGASWTRRGLVLRGLLISGLGAVAGAWFGDDVDAKKKKRRKKKKKKKGSATESNPPAHWEIDSEEQEFLRLINAYRAEKGKRALTLNTQLSNASAAHSLDMGLHGYFDHVNKQGKDPGNRASAAGYPWRVIGENIAAGYAQDTAAEAFAMWRSSKEHNQNMLDSDFHDIGIGREQVEGSRWGWYWTTVFGTSA